jgi:iron(III) transport system permease protein
MNRTTLWTAFVGVMGFVLLPWYAVESMSLRSFGLDGSALRFGTTERWWLMPLIVPLLAVAIIALRGRSDERAGSWLVASGLAGFAYLLIQGFAIGLGGWNAAWLAALFGAPEPAQHGMGFGALVVAGALLLAGCQGLARRGWCRGDVFVVSSVGVVGVLIALFVFFPVAKILISAFTDNAGNAAPALFYDKITDASIWGFGCLGGGIACGSPGTPRCWRCWSGSPRPRSALPLR